MTIPPHLNVCGYVTVPRGNVEMALFAFFGPSGYMIRWHCVNKSGG